MTKRALIVGARDERPKQEVDPTPSLATMRLLLDELGGWTVEILTGDDADRPGILAAVEGLVAAVEPGDEVLFYYFGHGGVVQFRRAPAWIGARPVFYLCASRPRDSSEMTGVLDVELSAALARIDEAGARVSAVLDCCHSAQIVRGDIRTVEAPSWLASEDPTGGRASRPHSHPRIVRLTGTSSLNYAYASRGRGGAALGYLTEAFADVLREAGPDRDRLTWDALAHRVRECAIQRRRCEGQWVTFAGPRERLVFRSAHAELPRSVGFVRGREGETGGWLRAGLIQGVEVGQVWGLGELLLDDQLRPRLRARVRVIEVDLNRARVEPVEPGASLEHMPDGTSALVLDAQSARRRVALRGPDALREAIAASAWLEPADADDPSAWAELDASDGSALRAARRDSKLALRLPADDSVHATSWARELIEDWARAQTLLDVLERAPEALREPPLRIAWGRRVDGRDQPLPTDGGPVELREGDPLYFELAHRGRTPEIWYVSAIEIGVDARAVLLDPAEPEGRAVAPRRTEFFGRRARQIETGRPIVWPEGVARAGALPLRIVFLFSLRPLELGHLVREQPPRWPSKKRRGGPVTRRTGPDPGRAAPKRSDKWGWWVLDAKVRPRG